MSDIYNSIFIFGARYLYLIMIIVTSVWLSTQSRSKQKEILIFICICFPLIYITSTIASYFYYNPRPFVLGHFKPLIPHKANNGFPSHHILLVSAISAVVFVFNRRLSALLWILTLFIGVSRIYVGVHYFVDVVASVLIAIVTVTMVRFAIIYFKDYDDK